MVCCMIIISHTNKCTLFVWQIFVNYACGRYLAIICHTHNCRLFVWQIFLNETCCINDAGGLRD